MPSEIPSRRSAALGRNATNRVDVINVNGRGILTPDRRRTLTPPVRFGRRLGDGRRPDQP